MVIERAKNTDSAWQSQQAALSVRSQNSLLVVASNSDHRVQLQQPGLVAAGIEAVVDSANKQTSLGACPVPITASGGVCLAAGTALPENGVTVSVLLPVIAGCTVLLVGMGAGVFSGQIVLRRARSVSPAEALPRSGRG